MTVKKGDWVKCKCDAQCNMRGIVLRVIHRHCEIYGHERGKRSWDTYTLGTHSPHQPTSYEKRSIVLAMLKGWVEM